MQETTGQAVGEIGGGRLPGVNWNFILPGVVIERIVGFIVFFTLFLSACAFPTQGAHLYGKSNPDFTFDLSQPIYVSLSESATENDKAFLTLLVSEMKRLGLSVTNQLSQNTLVLFFALNSNSNAILAPLPGNAAISQLPRQWQEISLELFSLNHIDVQGPVWSGNISVRRSEFQANPTGTVTSLLGLVGKNYEGPISAQPFSESQRRIATDEMAQGQQAQIQNLERRIGELENEQKKTGETSFSTASQEKIPRVELALHETCYKRDTQACITLAERYLKGEEISADPQRAVQLYEHACAEQNGKACTHLGLLYYQGIGVPQDPSHAKILFRQGCRFKDKMGCTLSEGVN
ncbi:MAG TPA: tetratricopeptide repeat protein [Nitrospirales bacterium]|nr:hypothetical protein [Nitrospiraceae bacterium]HNP28015.1 tetratricopeptide repeat protein [Nitrospirales bacterium]